MVSHKQYIREWKSINNDVSKLASALSREILRISKNDKVSIGNVIHFPFIEGEFNYDIGRIIDSPQEKFGMKVIKVQYLLYFFDSVDEYNLNVKMIGSSEASFEDKKIIIRGGLIEGYFNYLITQEIYHELDHIFEYGMGLKKRETLYDRVANDMRNANNEVVEAVAKLIYYTFAHEQDAFIHQFYGLLKHEGAEASDELFQEYIMNYSIYREVISSYDVLKQNMRNNRKTIADYLNSIGMSMEQFNKRIYFGRKRLERKLRKAFQRYCYETNGIRESNITSKMLKGLVIEDYRRRYEEINYLTEKYIF